MSTLTSPYSTPNPRLTLTARGRLLLGASGLVVALSLLSATTAVGDGGNGAGATSATSSSGYEVIRVLPGETLWSIASQLSESFSTNTGDIVSWIVDLNNLTSSELQAGQKLRIPTR